MTVKKKMGRPPEDTSPVMVRMHNDMIKEIDDLRRQMEDLPTRPEVIRRAVRAYLDASGKG